MVKELIISIVIVVGIVAGDIFLGNFIDEKLNNTMGLLDEVRNLIEEKKYDEAGEKIKGVESYWNESEEFLAYYIEHDELEKVKTELSSLKTYVQNQDDEALEKVNIMSYILEHIEEKDKLNLKNVF